MAPRSKSKVLLALVIGFLLGFRAQAQDGARLRNGFDRMDVDGDGRLSQEELSRFPRLMARLAAADSNGDGALEFEEFGAAFVAASVRPVVTTGTVALGPGDFTRTVRVGDVDRRYRIHVPPSYDPSQPTEVVVALHGGGGNPDSLIRLSGLNDKSDEAGFIVVYPYGSGRIPDRFLTFNAGNVGGYAMRENIDDVGFVRVLLDDLATVVHVDSGRVYATGLSNGAMMSYRLASELADRFAAIAPVGGPMGAETCRPSRPVAVMHFHGTADRFAPFEGGRGERALGARGVTDFYSVEHSVRNWVRANGCSPEPTVETLPDRADDGMRVVRKTWGGGREGSEVVLIEIRGGGHTWPGAEPPPGAAFLGASTRDISANDLMWAFFQKHARKAGER